MCPGPRFVLALLPLLKMLSYNPSRGISFRNVFLNDRLVHVLLLDFLQSCEMRLLSVFCEGGLIAPLFKQEQIIAASDITFYRLQCDSDGNLRSYIAEGEILDVRTRSFGGIGVFAIPEMGRFYRHVLIEKRYPHHGAVAFSHVGKALFDVFRFLGVKDIAYNQPKSLPYPTENPFA